MRNIRVLIAEPFPVTQEGICAILKTSPDLNLVGRAANIQEALSLTLERQPDIFLLDLKIGGLPPAELMARLYQSCPQMKALALSDAWGDANVRNLVVAGVVGYVDKTETPEKIMALYVFQGGG